MSESAKLQRLAAPADKEVASQQINVAALISGELLPSALTAGYARKRVYLYNATDSASGEIYIGPSGVTPDTGMVLPKATWVELSCSSRLDLYAVADDAGNELRILELS